MQIISNNNSNNCFIVGTYGFVLPADQIISVGQETLDGFIELVHVARELGQL